MQLSSISSEKSIQKKRTLIKFKYKDIAISLLIFSTMAFTFSKTIADPDLWGHLRFGLDFIENGGLTQSDPYSYLTAGQHWINHEWLAEVLFALSWKAGASQGLVLFKLAICILTSGIVFLYLRSLKLPAIRAGILVLLTYFSLIPFLGVIRPQMFTALLFTVTLIIIVKAEKGNHHWLWMAVPCFILWINLHGGILAGMGLLSIWAVLHAIKYPEDLKKIAAPVLVALLSPVINPYGIDLLDFLFRTATVPRPEIADWQPLKLVSFFGFVYLLLLILSIISFVYSSKKRNHILIILFGIIASLPFIANRHLMLFGLAVLILAGEHIGDLWNKISPQKVTNQKRISPWVAVVATILAILGLLGAWINSQKISITAFQPPIAAMEIIKQSGVQGKLATEFAWGEYLIWHLSPSVKVSIDGRRETVYSSGAYRQSQNFLSGTEEWDSLLDNYKTDMALVKPNSPSYNLLSLKKDWAIVYRDPIAVLFCNIELSMCEDITKSTTKFQKPIPPDHFP
jgi:hypothetical protein